MSQTTLASALAASSPDQASAQPRSLASIFWRRLRANRLAIVAALILLLIVAAVLAAPWLTPYERDAQNLRQRFLRPSLTHYMGADDLGRDVWTRVLYGGRVSLAVGALSVVVSIVVGALVGLASGFFGGWLDSVLMRLTDIFLAVPRYFVLILLAVYLRALNLPWVQAGSFAPIALVIGVFAWMGVARLVRASTLEVRECEYITAARCLGVRNSRILFTHILPNVTSPIIVAASLGLAGAIITESGLSYLGLGVQLPTPTWGNMLSNTQTYLTTAPWMALFPGSMIFLVVLCINYLGDALRDALDPRSIVGK
jgi:peptide/nickel transport system permease protein